MLPSRRTDHQTHSRVAVVGKRSIWGIVEVFHKRGILSWPAYRKDGRTDGRAQFRPLARKILWEAYGVQPMKCHALNIASYTTPVSQRDNYVRNIIVKVTQIYICIFVWFCHFHMLSIHTLRPPPFFFISSVIMCLLHARQYTLNFQNTKMLYVVCSTPGTCSTIYELKIKHSFSSNYNLMIPSVYTYHGNTPVKIVKWFNQYYFL